MCLTDILPSSIEKVEVVGDVDIAGIKSLLSGLPRNKKKCLPRLKSIGFAEYVSGVKEGHWIRTWRKKCHNVDVELTIGSVSN